MSIDPSSDRALYQQVADRLRERIHAGELGPGDKLPSETELIEQFEVNRTTTRRALQVLITEGLVHAQRGRGVFVRDRQQVRRVASSRYQAARSVDPPGPGSGAQTPFTRDQAIDWTQYQLEPTIEEVPANSAVAELLGVEEGTLLVARHFVFYADGQPQQTSTSYLLADMVAGTPVADPANEPWPGGTIAQLATVGVHVDRVEESVSARMPDPSERRTLRIGEGVPVLCVTRTMFAGTQAVEAAVDIVMPADRFVLDYTIPLDPP